MKTSRILDQLFLFFILNTFYTNKMVCTFRNQINLGTVVLKNHGCSLEPVSVISKFEAVLWILECKVFFWKNVFECSQEFMSAVSGVWLLYTFCGTLLYCLPWAYSSVLPDPLWPRWTKLAVRKSNLSLFSSDRRKHYIRR